MNAETLFQEKINAVSKDLNDARRRIKRAKAALLNLADHFDEYSSGRMRNELIAIAEEIL